MTIPSPCISVCVTDPDSDLCYGCARTTPEITKWSKYTDEEKKEVIEIGRSRMDGWQLEAFDKAYEQKVETGLSPIKKQKLQNKEEQLLIFKLIFQKFLQKQKKRE